MKTKNITKKDIVRYYDQCEIDYKLLWNLDNSMAMHFGYWNRGTFTLTRALENENKLLAKLADIKETDHVLDAGCGVGGSTIFLAKNIGCKAVGITLSTKQVQEARQNAAKNKTSQRASFYVMDFTETSFRDESFDVVWAIESVCHAENKKDFIKEAYRLLKPGGRLVVADGFKTKRDYQNSEEAIMHSWLSGWAVNSLDNVDEFNNSLREGGFNNTAYKNITKNVMPSSWRLFMFSLLTKVLGFTAEKLRIRSTIQTANITAAQNQYIALKRNLWEYGIFTAKKQK